MQGDYNGYNYDTISSKIYFSLKRVLKSKKKKLALTFLYCTSQATWLDDSWKPIYISQSRFYKFFPVGKFKDVQHNSKIF